MVNSHLILLGSSDIGDVWPDIRGFFQDSCDANEVAATEMEADDILLLVATGMAIVFVVLEESVPVLALAFQFNDSNGHKGADIIAMGGSDLLRHKRNHWKHILDWLRANEVEFIDAYVPQKYADLYQKRLGFSKSSVLVRKML